MTRLNYLHEPALLYNLAHRFQRDHVYTYTGRICIAVNPFNWQASGPQCGKKAERVLALCRRYSTPAGE